MRKLIFGLPVFLISAFLLPASAQETPKKPIRTLIIDPGHGGLDPGAMGLLQSEANTALQVSMKLGDSIAKAFPDIKLPPAKQVDL